MPKQLNNGKITEALQRAFGFKGRYIPMLDEVIVPVYNIADPSPANVTKLGAATTAVGGGLMPELTWTGLFNPPRSGVILNVTSAVVTTTDAKSEVDIRLVGDIGGANRGNVHFRDRRNIGLPSAQTRRDSAALALVGDLVAVVQIDGALSQTASWETSTGDPRQPLAVLREGTGLVVQNPSDLVTGISLRANFRFLEIPISQVNPAAGIPG